MSPTEVGPGATYVACPIASDTKDRISLHFITDADDHDMLMAER